MYDYDNKKENFIEMFDKLLKEHIITGKEGEGGDRQTEQATYVDTNIQPFRRPQPPARRAIPRGVPPPMPSPIPPVTRRAEPRCGVIAAQIYRQIRSLEETYKTLISLSRREQAMQIERMLQELGGIESTALEIYRDLSGRNDNPYTNNIYDRLPNNYCLALRVAFNRVSGLYDDLLALQRLINIPQTDRQLVIMASVLQRQLSTFNTLLIDCML